MKMNNIVLGRTKRWASGELAATASAKLCLWGLLQKPGLWKMPYHREGGMGAEGQSWFFRALRNWVLGWSASGSHG